ncbi:uncharacterized protein LOC125869831 [Solanum stenotomum]|uniref:uncharacterized protein LOC125869831 n=1 Tax=Solanum stenotomum TaxID=172797 RepID=UPI0020D0E94D|nr:uncharacterized protein LOC125869831 [Solanum stenotomum]
MNDRSGVYVPQSKRDRASGSSSGSKLEDMMAKMIGYDKFMKDLVTKKRVVGLNFINDVHHDNTIATKSLVQKKEDSCAFTIPCTIGSISFAKALCDLGANINLMPLAIYKKLGLGDPRPILMRLMMADRSVKRPVGVLCDVLVKVDTFILLVDFAILDCEVDFEVPIILGRPFLATGRALVDVERGELKFTLNKEEVKFNICRSMKQPNDMNVISAIEVVAEEDMRGMGAHSYAPKKLDLDLKNRPSPPAKPSVEDPPVLELKELRSHLIYVFLGTNNTLPVILAVDLNKE